MRDPGNEVGRLHTNFYKFGENVSLHIFHEKNCCDLNLGESLCICTFFLFPDSGLNLLNGFDFLFWSILNGVTLKTSNTKARSYAHVYNDTYDKHTAFCNGGRSEDPAAVSKDKHYV